MWRAAHLLFRESCTSQSPNGGNGNPAFQGQTRAWKYSSVRSGRDLALHSRHNLPPLKMPFGPRKNTFSRRISLAGCSFPVWATGGNEDSMVVLLSQPTRLVRLCSDQFHEVFHQFQGDMSGCPKASTCPCFSSSFLTFSGSSTYEHSHENGLH